MVKEDIGSVAEIHSQLFLRQHSSEKWIKSNFAAYPRVMMFVARDQEGKVVGYIQWTHKSGFRKEAVIELEQIGVTRKYQNQGIGRKLIVQSLNEVKNYLGMNNSIMKSILISTRIDNEAQNLYKSVLGAKVVATISELYSSDEVLMIAAV